MILNTQQSLIIIGAIALTTLFTRAFPFLIFPQNKETPKYIMYLGKVLPYAIIGMLIVYCLKGTTVLQSPFALPEIIGVLSVIVLHHIKHNTLLSIGGGTVIYMFLVQVIFP